MLTNGALSQRGKIDSTTSNLRPNGAADIGAFSYIGATAPPTLATATASASGSTTAALTTNSVITTTAAAAAAGAGAGAGAGGMTSVCVVVRPLVLLVTMATMLLL